MAVTRAKAAALAAASSVAFDVDGVPVGFLKARLEEARTSGAFRDDGDLVPVVLMITGSFNPVHKLHVRGLALSRACLEASGRFFFVGSLLSPSHDDYVRGKLGDKHIDGTDRFAMTKLAAASEDGCAACAWELVQPEFVDFPSVCRKVEEVIQEHVDPKIEIVYVCGTDHAIKCHLLHGRFRHRLCAVGRPDSSGSLSKLKEMQDVFGPKVHLVDADVDFDVSSTEIRTRRTAGKPVTDLTGAAVEIYLDEHELLPRS